MHNNFSINNFSASEWVSEYANLPATISPDTFEPILHFSLIWNIFESSACGKNANPQTIRRAVNREIAVGRFDEGIFTEHLDFFRRYARRYAGLNDPNLDCFFNYLLMEDNDHKNIVRRAFNNDSCRLNDVVYALLLIAYRIRNNLFHGNKEVSYLYTQVDLFKATNSLIAKYLSITRTQITPNLE